MLRQRRETSDRKTEREREKEQKEGGTTDKTYNTTPPAIISQANIGTIIIQ